MSHNSRSTYTWNQRAEWLEKKQAAKDAAEAERKRLENTEANFPTLSTAHPVASQGHPEGYANFAKKWADDDAVDRRVDEVRRSRSSMAARTNANIYIAIKNNRSTRDDYDDDDEDEDDTPTPAVAQTGVAVGMEKDDQGWTEVKHKVRKVKRELTIDEMDERDRLRDDMNDMNEREFNGQLFESNRHDHDRV